AAKKFSSLSLNQKHGNISTGPLPRGSWAHQSTCAIAQADSQYPVMSRSRIIVLLVASHALAFVTAWLYFAPPDRGGLGGWLNLTVANSPHRPVRAETTTTKPAPLAPPITIFKTNAFHW